MSGVHKANTGVQDMMAREYELYKALLLFNQHNCENPHPKTDARCRKCNPCMERVSWCMYVQCAERIWELGLLKREQLPEFFFPKGMVPGAKEISQMPLADFIRTYYAGAAADRFLAPKN